MNKHQSVLIISAVISMIVIMIFVSVAAILAYIYIKHRNANESKRDVIETPIDEAPRPVTPDPESNVFGLIIRCPEKAISIFDGNDYEVSIIKNSNDNLEPQARVGSRVYYLQPNANEKNIYHLNLKRPRDKGYNHLILLTINEQITTANLNFLDKECRYQLDVSNDSGWNNVCTGYPKRSRKNSKTNRGQIPLAMDRCYRLFVFIQRSDDCSQ